MVNVDLDKSRAIRLRARVNETSVPTVFTFIDVNGDPVDITTYDFKLAVFKSVGSSLKFFTLSIGSGLTIQGADSNQLLVEITAAQATVKADTYFFRFYSSDEDQTWLNGPFEFHQGEFDSTSTETTIEITTSEITITIAASSGGGTVEDGTIVFCGEWDLSTNVIPQTGGTGAANSIKQGNQFFIRIGVDTDLPGFPTGSDGGPLIAGYMMQAAINNPGIQTQDTTKWYIFQTIYQP